MSVKRFQVKADGLIWLTPCKKATASKAADIDVIHVTNTGDLPNAGSMDRSLYITQYEHLKRPGPFTCNLKGVVTFVDDVYESNKGINMRAFSVSSSQYVIACMAYGEHATCEDIDVGNEIAIHKIQSRKGLKGQAGKMWIYDDAFVMCLGSGMPLPSPLLPDIVLTFME